MTRATFTLRLLGATATLMLAAACGSNSAPVTVAGTAAVSGVPAPGETLGVAKTSLGTVLVDSKGMTVYLLTADTPGHSTCSAQCLQYWPLVSAPSGGTMPSAQGVSAALSATKATSGASMVTAGGWPLYTFVKDQAPGDVTGEGVKTFGGTWYAVSPSGVAVKAAPAGAPATTTPASGYGNGY
jgi:predicted lipoprotein with Yx(FWY)xxD motif